MGRAIVESQDEKTAEKFRKLMGIKQSDGGGDASQDMLVKDSVASIEQMQRQAFEAMDKEYQIARMTTHTHRGMGLGFASSSTAVIDPNLPQQLK